MTGDYILNAAIQRCQKELDEAMTTLEDTLPFLIRMGDFIGNGEGPTKMERCNMVGRIRDMLDSYHRPIRRSDQ